MILSGVILKELKLEAELIKFINHEKTFNDLGSGSNFVLPISRSQTNEMGKRTNI